MMRFKNRSAMAEFTSLSRLDRIDTAARKNWRSDDDFQSDMLEQVSRTFALTIPQLPSELGRVVANAYLLCRIVDTIEDEPAVSPTLKGALCGQFVAALRGADTARQFSQQLLPLLSARSANTEYELIEQADRVVAITHQFSPAQQEALIECVVVMG